MRNPASPRVIAIAVAAYAVAAAAALGAHAGSLDKFRDTFGHSRFDGFRFGYGAFLGERHDDYGPPGHLGDWDRPEDEPPERRERAPEERPPADAPNELEDRAG